MKKTLLLAIFLLPTLAFATIDSNLKYGSRGVEVTELQEFLIDKGFLTGQPTGNFFALTKKAVISYQKSLNLPATGFVGQLTRAEINKELEVNNEAEIQETGAVNQPVSNNVDDLLKKIADLTEQQKTQQEQTNRLIESNKHQVQTASDNPIVEKYSSFKFDYIWRQDIKEFSYTDTSRTLRFKKIVMRTLADALPDSAKMTMVIYYDNNNKEEFPMEKIGVNTFIFVGNLTVNKNPRMYFKINPVFHNSNPDIYPQMNEWSITDETEKLPLKIQCGELLRCNVTQVE